MKPFGAGASFAGARARVALGLAVFAGVACASYAVQRLGSSAAGEPGPAAALSSLYADYYWRLGLAALHGAVAGSAIGLAVSPERARAWLLPAGRIVAAAVLLCVTAMAVVP